MPFKGRKISQIILEECDKIDENERCTGYRDKLLDLVTGIIEAEQKHRLEGINIQKKINGMCNAAGRFLAEHQQHMKETEENS